MNQEIFFFLLYNFAIIFLALEAFDEFGTFLALIGGWVALFVPGYLFSLIQEPANPWVRFNLLLLALSAGAYLYWLWTVGKGSGVSSEGMQDPYGDGE